MLTTAVRVSLDLIFCVNEMVSKARAPYGWRVSIEMSGFQRKIDPWPNQKSQEATTGPKIL